jgi:hypothetical protein
LVCWILLSSLTSYGQTPTPSESSEKPKPSAEQPKKRTKSDQRGTETSPLFIKIIPPDNAQPEPNDTKANHNEKSPNEGWASAERWVAIFTGLLWVTTAILASYTAFLWGATKRLANDAKDTADRQARETQESLRIATESANAAKLTVKTMEDTARKELRAYMGVDHIVIYDDHLSSDSGHADIRIKNFGNTMAKSTQIWIEASEPVGDPDFNEKGERRAKTVVMPKEALGFKQPIERTMGGTMSNLNPGILRIWGRIEYTDVFGQDHWTTFRFMNDRRTSFPSPSGVGHQVYGWSTKTCDEGNDAD